MHLIIAHASGYIEEEGVNRYLVFDSTDENTELLKKYNDILNGIKNKIKEINSDKCDYEKDYIKINLILMMTEIKQTIKISQYDYNYQICFWRDDKIYPQVFLDDTLYELNALV